MAGRLDDALLQLARAEGDLGRYTRAFSASYAESCRMFLLYERARVLVDLERGLAAERAARDALALARGRGFWPALGILRTLAWALLLDGRDSDARAVADEAATLAFDTPPSMRAFAQRMVVEARGRPRRDGEVY
jgi:hypothetical protein